MHFFEKGMTVSTEAFLTDARLRTVSRRVGSALSFTDHIYK